MNSATSASTLRFDAIRARHAQSSSRRFPPAARPPRPRAASPRCGARAASSEAPGRSAQVDARQRADAREGVLRRGDVHHREALAAFAPVQVPAIIERQLAHARLHAQRVACRDAEPCRCRRRDEDDAGTQHVERIVGIADERRRHRGGAKGIDAVDAQRARRVPRRRASTSTTGTCHRDVRIARERARTRARRSRARGPRTSRSASPESVFMAPLELRDGRGVHQRDGESRARRRARWRRPTSASWPRLRAKAPPARAPAASADGRSLRSAVASDAGARRVPRLRQRQRRDRRMPRPRASA